MAGKSWQPSHELPCRRDKAGTCHTDKTMERELRDRGRGNNLSAQSPVIETQMLKENTDNVKLLECLVAQEHVEFWRTRRSKCADRNGET